MCSVRNTQQFHSQNVPCASREVSANKRTLARVARCALAATMWLTGTHTIGAELAAATTVDRNNPIVSAPETSKRAAIIEEIIVTSDYRQSSLDKFTGSAAVIDAATISQRGATHVEELLGGVANLNATAGSSRARFYQIRGIGERSQFAEPLNPSVGLLLDGVDFSGLGTAATTFDVAQVELLRGPQGTRYGANALAGLISVQSHAPNATPELSLQSEVADYGTYSIGAAGGGPVGSDQLLYRLAVQQHRSNGYIDNRTVSRKHTNDFNELTSRGRLRWLPSDPLTVDVIAGFVDVDNGYDAFSLDNNRKTLSDQPGKDAQRSRYLTLSTHWDATPAFALISQISAEHSNSDYGYDEDWTFVGFHPDGYTSTDRYRRDRHSASAELRIVSTPDGALLGGTTDWLGGVYVIRESVALQRSYVFFTALFDSKFTTHRAAAFAETRMHLSPAWTLTTGLRLESRRADYKDSEAVRFSPNESLWGGNITLSYESPSYERNAGTLLYATVARGYKAGGFNTDGTLPGNLRQYQDERALNIEAGAKGALLDGALIYRLALFNMLRRDVQIASSTTIVRADNSAEFIDYVGNAANGRNRGIELETDYRPIEPLRLFSSIGLLNTEYQKFVNARGARLDGRDQAQAPRYTFSVGVEYQIAPQWKLRLEDEGKAGYFFDDSNNTRAHSYRLLGARLNYEAKRWHVALWGKNLLDEKYQTRGFFFGNDPRIGYADHSYTQLGEPRRVGVTASLDL